MKKVGFISPGPRNFAASEVKRGQFTAGARFGRGLKRAFFSLFLCGAVLSTAEAAPQSEKKEALSRARQSYYNLRRAGLIEFQTKIKPNWNLLLLGVESNAGVLKHLNALNFFMSIDSESRFRLDHSADVTPLDKKTADGFDSIFKGMDQAVSQFVATWSVFMLTSPFPRAESDFELIRVADQYRFSQKQGATDVLTITDSNFMIIEIKVSGAGFKASLKPVLQKTAKGFILRGYSGDYLTPSGARNTLLLVRIDYQEVSGLQLLRKVHLDTVFEGKPAQLECVFSDYKVKVR